MKIKVGKGILFIDRLSGYISIPKSEDQWSKYKIKLSNCGANFYLLFCILFSLWYTVYSISPYTECCPIHCAFKSMVALSERKLSSKYISLLFTRVYV